MSIKRDAYWPLHFKRTISNQSSKRAFEGYVQTYQYKKSSFFEKWWTINRFFSEISILKVLHEQDSFAGINALNLLDYSNSILWLSLGYCWLQLWTHFLNRFFFHLWKNKLSVFLLIFLSSFKFFNSIWYPETRRYI